MFATDKKGRKHICEKAVSNCKQKGFVAGNLCFNIYKNSAVWIKKSLIQQRYRRILMIKTTLSLIKKQWSTKQKKQKKDENCLFLSSGSVQNKINKLFQQVSRRSAGIINTLALCINFPEFSDNTHRLFPGITFHAFHIIFRRP